MNIIFIVGFIIVILLLMKVCINQHNAGLYYKDIRDILNDIRNYVASEYNMRH